MSTMGPWRAVRDSQQLRAMKKGGLCRRRRACESGIFSTSVAKTPPLAPSTPTKRQMRREKTRMLDARPRVRQEHEKAASRHCLPRRPPGSASRIFSGEGEGAQRTPTSPRSSWVCSLSTEQIRMASWQWGSPCRRRVVEWFPMARQICRPALTLRQAIPCHPAAPLVQESQSRPLEDPHDSWPRPSIGRSHRPPSLGACRDPRFQPRHRTSTFGAILSAITTYRGIDEGGQSRSHQR